MKKARKGFTLVEVLIVMGIMGILGAMIMIGGQQASDAARGTAIADNLEKAAAAMQAYYIDNSAKINVSGTTAAKVAKGASAYLSVTLKDASTIDDLAAGEYGVVLTAEDDANANWYLVYKLVENEFATDRKVAAILASKADKMNLKDKAVDGEKDSGVADDASTLDVDESKTPDPVAPYDGTTDTVYMKVR